MIAILKKINVLNNYWKDFLRLEFESSKNLEERFKLKRQSRICFVCTMNQIPFWREESGSSCLLFQGFASSLRVYSRERKLRPTFEKFTPDWPVGYRRIFLISRNGCDPPWWLILACARFESAVYNISGLVTSRKRAAYCFVLHVDENQLV